MDLQLGGRVALVTGGSRGIGRAIVQLLAREGAIVALTYHQQRAKAEQAVAMATEAGGNAFCLPLDLTSLDSIKAAVEAVQQKYKRLDILINNAVATTSLSGAQVGRFEDMPPDDWQKLLRANIEGTYTAVQRCVPYMRERKWGRIVTVSSTVADDGFPGFGCYSTFKSSLHGLTRTLSKELANSEILVNCVMPGVTLTDRTDGLPPSTHQFLANMSSLKRFLQPGEVAAAVVFLCSGANTMITGEVLRLGGGRGL